MKKAVMFGLCLAGVLLNMGFYRLVVDIAGLHLYVDTVFTIAITLSCGLWWGMLCGALTNLIGHSITMWGWEGYLFTLCSIATALVTWLFMRLFPRDLDLTAERRAHSAALTGKRFNSRRLSAAIEKTIALILLSFALCLAMSILGGLIASFIQLIHPSYEKNPLHLSVFPMFGNNLPPVFMEILSRIPINIVDRLVSVFIGFGAAVLIKMGNEKLAMRKEQRREKKEEISAR